MTKWNPRRESCLDRLWRRGHPKRVASPQAWPAVHAMISSSTSLSASFLASRRPMQPPRATATAQAPPPADPAAPPAATAAGQPARRDQLSRCGVGEVRHSQGRSPLLRFRSLSNCTTAGADAAAVRVQAKFITDGEVWSRTLESKSSSARCKLVCNVWGQRKGSR